MEKLIESELQLGVEVGSQMKESESGVVIGSRSRVAQPTGL